MASLQVGIRNTSNSSAVIFLGKSIPDNSTYTTFTVETNRIYELEVSKKRAGAVLVGFWLRTKTSTGGARSAVSNPQPVGVILDGADLGVNVDTSRTSSAFLGKHTVQFYTEASGKGATAPAISNVSASNEGLQVEMFKPTENELTLRASIDEGSVHDDFTKASLLATLEGKAQPDPKDYYKPTTNQITPINPTAVTAEKQKAVTATVAPIAIGIGVALLLFYFVVVRRGKKS